MLFQNMIFNLKDDPIETLDLKLLRKVTPFIDVELEYLEDVHQLELEKLPQLDVVTKQLTLTLLFAYERSDRRHRVYTFDDREELQVFVLVYLHVLLSKFNSCLSFLKLILKSFLTRSTIFY